MADEYLWDRSAPPDLEIVRLERALGRYRQARRSPGRGRQSAWWIGAAAACLAIGMAVLWVRRPLSEWQMNGKRVLVGQTIRTGKAGTAKLEAPFFGQVELGPEAQLEVLGGKNGSERLALRRGRMRAMIWAPPAKFRVDTPSAQTIDLGCSYTLTVLPDDSGLVTVQMGWVAFQAGARESFIPAGAACRTGKAEGPGVPYFESASRELQEGVHTFEASRGRDGLNKILTGAEPRDALTLWHLLSRTNPADRALVAKRLATFVPSVDVAKLQAGDARALDDAWNALGLGGAEWWRTWKQEWSLQR